MRAVMRFRAILPVLAVVPAFVSGCMGGGEPNNAGEGNETGTPSGGAGGGNQTVWEEIANATLTLRPQESNVLPGSNATVATPVNVTGTFSAIMVNTTIEQGTSVGLRFFGLGGCEGTVAAPVTVGRTYSTECGAVAAGSYNLTYAHTSGTVTFRVVVLGSR